MQSKKLINIGNKELGENCQPFIVAELSGNHQQDFSLATRMIEAAANAGADAIKLQTYTADTMTLNNSSDEFMVNEENSLWKGESLYDLYAKASTPWQWHQPLFEKAKSLGMCAFSSPFDSSSVDFLETLDVPCYKIASFENNDLPLIKKVALTGKPIIVSTGMASIKEIEELLAIIAQTGNEQVILLKCTSNYPADASDSHLATMIDMKKRFNSLVGLSDHSIGITTSLASVAMGACMIEKHFVLDRKAGGVDAAFSIEPDELKLLVEQSKMIKVAIGKVKYGGSDNEQSSKKYRRSIYVSQNIKAGELFTQDNLKVIRPGYGLKPKYFDKLMGKKSLKNIAIGSSMSWDFIGD